SPDGSQIVSGSHDHTARLWKVGSQQNTVTYTEHHQAVFSVAWSPNGSLIASGGQDNTVQIWSDVGVTRYRYPDQEAPVNAISWFSNGERLIIGTLGNGTREISLLTKGIAQLGAKGTIRAVAVSPSGRYLAVGADTGFVAIFDLANLRQRSNHRIHTKAVLSLAWSPDGKRFASGGDDNVVHVVDFASGHIIHNLSHTSEVNGVAWDPEDADRLATASSDGKMRVWATENGTHQA